MSEEVEGSSTSCDAATMRAKRSAIGPEIVASCACSPIVPPLAYCSGER